MSNQLTTQSKQPLTVQQMLQSDAFKKNVALSLPKHLSPDRFARVALVALNRTPKLAQCTQASLFQCLYDLSALGLEPDGRRAHLIPYGDKCTLIVDYKGLAELVRRSGEVADLHADVVCENDDFSYCFGTDSHLKHKINLRKERGEVIGAYSYVRLKDGSDSFDVLQKEEIEAVRKRSRSGSSGPWVTDWNEMAKKTAFRRHSKWLPLSPELRDRIEKDDDIEALSPEQRADIAKPIFGQESTPPPTPQEVDAQVPAPASEAEVVIEPPATTAQPEPRSQPAAEHHEPSSATTQMDLDNLCLDNAITESALIKYGIENRHFGPEVKMIRDIPEAKKKLFVKNFKKIAEAISKQAAQ